MIVYIVYDIINPVSPELTMDLDENEICDGMFLEVSSFTVRVAEFYLKVNHNRKDKLK